MEGKGGNTKTLIGNDFNAKTGQEGGRVKEEETDEAEERVSKDKKINKERRFLLDREK